MGIQLSLCFRSSLLRREVFTLKLAIFSSVVDLELEEDEAEVEGADCLKTTTGISASNVRRIAFAKDTFIPLRVNADLLKSSKVISPSICGFIMLILII
jgi:hypothetical protein